MGASAREQAKASRNGKKRLVWRTNTILSEPCDWGAVDPGTIRGTIDAVAKLGGACMFGVTSDGGAYSVCVLLDDQKIKEYPHGVVECEASLRSIMEWCVDALV